jgi:hypothetical protein
VTSTSVVRGLPAMRRVGLRNRVSPFSTGNVVYAGLVLQRSTRFQQVWKNLWTTGDFPVQMGRFQGSARSLALGAAEGKSCSFRSSVEVRAVENAPSSG